MEIKFPVQTLRAAFITYQDEHEGAVGRPGGCSVGAGVTAAAAGAGHVGAFHSGRHAGRLFRTSPEIGPQILEVTAHAPSRGLLLKSAKGRGCPRRHKGRNSQAERRRSFRFARVSQKLSTRRRQIVQQECVDIGPQPDLLGHRRADAVPRGAAGAQQDRLFGPARL